MKPFAALERDECRWPLDGGFCGCRTRHGRSYCEAHDATAHRVTPMYSDAESARIADVITGVTERSTGSRNSGRDTGYATPVDCLPPWRGIAVGFGMENMSLVGRRR